MAIYTVDQKNVYIDQLKASIDRRRSTGGTSSVMEAQLNEAKPTWAYGTVQRYQIFDAGRRAGLKGVPSFIWKNRCGTSMYYYVPNNLNDLSETKKAVRQARVRQARPAAIRPVNLQVLSPPVTPTANNTSVFQVDAVTNHGYAYVPPVDKNYIRGVNFPLVHTVLVGGIFFPIYICGISGNGKTVMVEQAAAYAGKQMIRVQISRETDEDDLIGGFRLVNGETKFIKGPAVRAMELGCLLLVDEADRGDPAKIMCLQGILEGKTYHIKKTGEVVYPQPGFNVIVTANTNGRSGDARYVSASILDDAWLERFPVTINQEYPSENEETQILKRILAANNSNGDISDNDNEVAKSLVKWANVIRRTYREQAIDETISTRRLIHISRAYMAFGDLTKAVELCTNRYDTEIRKGFMDLFTKIVDVQQPKNSEPGTNPNPVVEEPQVERDPAAIT